MFWIILISILTATLLWILLGPVILYLDTEQQQYRLALPGILSVALVPSDEIFHLRIRAFLVPFRIHPFRARRRRKKQIVREKKKGIRELFQNMDLGRKLLRTIRIRRLYLDLDTEDFLLNTWLTPAFSMVNKENIHLQANFEGRASLMMDARTRLGSIFWTMAQYKYHTFINR